jgi:signal transduction histidine kinase
MFNHVASMPDVLRANIYAADRTILWSSNPGLIGKTYGSNPDLDEALEGIVTAESGVVTADGHDKPERATMEQGTTYFVESYLPIRIRDGSRVAGVVEIYKTPRRLFATIRTMQTWLWIGAGLSGLFLYVALFWMVRRADNVIRRQQEQLVQSETLAAMGEMGTAVAHGIRNPLAAIRSSAELALDSDPQTVREAAQDIIDEADRLETWVSSLLSYARPTDGSVRETDLGLLAQACAAGFARDAERRGIAVDAEIAGQLRPLAADPQLLGQVINSLISNALETAPPPTRVRVVVQDSDGRVRLQVVDDGSGMTPRQLAGAFRPFFTTKPKGLGIGLPLAKRIVERFGGTIAIDSTEGQGTTVTLDFPVRE